MKKIQIFNITLYQFTKVLQECMSSYSSRSQSERRSKSPAKQQHKLFVTNLDGNSKEDELEVELKELFSNYGKLSSLCIKKSRHGQYCYGFVEYESGANGEEAVKNLNSMEVKGKPMKVELQDNAKRRKDPDKGCYNCGKMGHFARECRNKDRGYRGRSRSRSYQRRRKYRRDRSDSYDDRSQRHHRKQRRHRSRSRDERKHKKHKKHKSRHRSSSGSRQ